MKNIHSENENQRFFSKSPVYKNPEPEIGHFAIERVVEKNEKI